MADQNNFVMTIAVQENPRIQQSNTNEITTFSIETRTEELDRYWLPIDIPERRRKFFPIEYCKLDDLMQATGQVGLVVKYINDPNEVTAEWVSFSPQTPPVLPENSVCFVLTEQYYNGIIAELNLGTASYSIGGLKRIKMDGMDSNFLVALIGKTERGDYTLYLQNASLNLIDEDPGGFTTSPGGEGVGGIKLKI